MLKYTIVGYGIWTFLEEENSDFGGGKWEIDAPQSNKYEFNHGGHINFTFADLERKNTKMFITRFLAISGRFLPKFQYSFQNKILYWSKIGGKVIGDNLGTFVKVKKATMDSVIGTIFELNWKSEKPIRPNSKLRIRNDFKLELIADLFL